MGLSPPTKQMVVVGVHSVGLVLSAINELGVPCYSGTCSEIYREKAIADRGLAPTDRLPIARQLGDTSLMFLVHPTLISEHTDMTCEVLARVMTEAAGSE